ncbi:MAG: response regulator [Bdellovibrionia bacterium]
MTSILIVDDEHDILLAAEILLSDEGFEVRTARNGREALERLAEKHPDIVLMDVMMPILTGPETIRQMKADPDYAKIPIILMSAVQPSFKSDEVAWDLFIRKPFEIDSLLVSIQKLLEKKKG